MNAKKCKLLRRRSRMITVGLPEVLYDTDPRTGAIRLAHCTRLAYKMAKKSWKLKLHRSSAAGAA